MRLAHPADADAIAGITAAAFEPAWATAARRERTPLLSPLASLLLAAARARVRTQVLEWASARADARAALRAEAAARYGPLNPPPAPHARRALARAASNRRTAVLVAEVRSEEEEDDEWRLVAALALLRRSAGAALPPPFPSTAPRVAYIASVATDPSFRRRGAARALLARARARAAAWGDEAIFLHAPRTPGAATALYEATGFGDAAGVAPWGAGLRVVGVEARRGGGGGARVLGGEAPPPPPPPLAAGERAEGGAYVWRVGEEEEEG